MVSDSANGREGESHECFMNWSRTYDINLYLRQNWWLFIENTGDTPAGRGNVREARDVCAIIWLKRQLNAISTRPDDADDIRIVNV